jgi:hypothetical protein
MAERIDITLPEEKREWQVAALKGALRSKRSIVVAHRRAGKTELAVTWLLVQALKARRKHPAPFFGYVSPFLNQSKAIAWERLRHYANKIPKTVINESELSVRLVNGSAIRLFGGDAPDRMRGLGFDGMVLDESSQIKPEVWHEIILPAMSDRKGSALFIGTPKGQVNLFYDIWRKALDEPEEWFSAMYRADQTGIFDDEELKGIASEVGENTFRQEYLCDFDAANVDSYITPDMYRAACARQKITNMSAPLVFGLDVARSGEDRNALVQRRGLIIEKIETWHDDDLMNTVGKVGLAINQRKPVSVFVDVIGVGAGVVDRLKQQGFRVRGVNVGERPAAADKFANRKAECWSRMRDWIVEEAMLDDREDLRRDLLAPFYSFDAQGRLKIERKEDLKKRLKFSTDIADALALTFAQPVASVDVRRNWPKFAEM